MADEKTFTQADIDAAVEAAIEKATGDVDGLKAKVEELIGDNKKLKGELRKSKDVDPAEVERLHSEVEELQGKLSAAEKAAKAAETERDKAVKALEGEKGFTNKLLVQDGIKSALLAAGVKDEDMIDVLSAKFAGSAAVESEGDARVAKIDGKPVSDFVKEWAATDAGKKFVAAPVNSGGGAPGGDGKNTGTKTMTRSAYNALSQHEQSALGSQMAKGGLTLTDG